jgi:Xaa-Pro aminopeptidase
MLSSRREFIKTLGISTAAASLSSLAACATPPAQQKKQLIPEMKPLSPPFRLSEAWHRQTIGRLQEKMAENGLDGMVCKEVWNIIYLSGLFHSSTERPFWLFIPKTGEPSIFGPGLDRDLISSWWIKDAEWYFDYPHHGEFNKVVYTRGPKADLEAWLLEHLGKRGFASATLGIEKTADEATIKRWKKTLPKANFKPAGDLLMKMRVIKTPEEIALTQKAIDLHDHMLEYARAYILDRGTDATDFDVRHATQEYATNLFMKWLPLDGKPHTGVGLNLAISCRAGIATAYPHPNQFFYHKIQKGDAIQIAGVVRIGGYGGEGYRALQTNPMNDLQKKMWEVHTEQTIAMGELCKAGTPCNEIAEKVLDLARKNDMEKYIYHRPAHGEGMEGHQEPYLSLGDETILQEGMMFSNEPGLYNPEGGFGYNHSNNILVGKDAGIRMNKTPLTKEWCWLTV